MMPAVHKKGAEEFQDLEGIDMVRLDRLNSTSSSSTRASSILEIEEPACTVDWTDSNYPPYLKIVHFDMDDLPVGEIFNAGKLLHLSLQLTIALLAVNIVDTLVVLALYEEAELVRLLYAVLNTVVFGSLGFYGFYRGFRGMVEEITDDLDAFRFAQTLLTIVMVCFAFVPCGSIEGLLSDAMLDRHTHGFWFVSATIESVGWLLDALLSWYVTAKIKDLMQPDV